MAIRVVNDRATLILFLKDIIKQQEIMLSYYEQARIELDKLEYTVMHDGTLTNEDLNHRQTLMTMAKFCERVMSMLNNLWYFASKELLRY